MSMIKQHIVILCLIWVTNTFEISIKPSTVWSACQPTLQTHTHTDTCSSHLHTHLQATIYLSEFRISPPPPKSTCNLSHREIGKPLKWDSRDSQVAVAATSCPETSPSTQWCWCSLEPALFVMLQLQPILWPFANKAPCSEWFCWMKRCFLTSHSSG